MYGFISLNSSMTINDYGCSSRFSTTGYGVGLGSFSPGCFGFGYGCYPNPFCCDGGLGFGVGMGLGYAAGMALPGILKGVGKACSWAWNGVKSLFGKKSEKT